MGGKPCSGERRSIDVSKTHEHGGRDHLGGACERCATNLVPVSARGQDCSQRAQGEPRGHGNLDQNAGEPCVERCAVHRVGTLMEIADRQRMPDAEDDRRSMPGVRSRASPASSGRKRADVVAEAIASARAQRPRCERTSRKLRVAANDARGHGAPASEAHGPFATLSEAVQSGANAQTCDRLHVSPSSDSTYDNCRLGKGTTRIGRGAPWASEGISNFGHRSHRSTRRAQRSRWTAVRARLPPFLVVVPACLAEAATGSR